MFWKTETKPVNPGKQNRLKPVSTNHDQANATHALLVIRSVFWKTETKPVNPGKQNRLITHGF